MIIEPEKFKIIDQSGKNTIEIEVNWRPEDEKINECKVLRIKINGEEGYVALGDLRTILFACSNPKEQRKMLPIQMVTQRKWQTVLGVKADHDIKKGEIVNFKVDIPLPPIEEEIMYQAQRIAKNNIVPVKNGIIRN